jgi:hypothetical protein
MMVQEQPQKKLETKEEKKLNRYRVSYEEYFDAEDALGAVELAMADIQNDPAWKLSPQRM